MARNSGLDTLMRADGYHAEGSPTWKSWRVKTEEGIFGSGSIGNIRKYNIPFAPEKSGLLPKMSNGRAAKMSAKNFLFERRRLLAVKTDGSRGLDNKVDPLA